VSVNQNAPFGGLSALLIDDSPAVIEHAAPLLKQLGLTVSTAVDGYAALSTLIDLRPDLVIADSQMPRLDGFQLCTLIKSHPRFVTTRVLLASTGSDLEIGARARCVQSDGWLAKPFTPLQLRGELEHHFNPRHSI
jgi:twitching motility two-component system response regulator PilG